MHRYDFERQQIFTWNSAVELVNENRRLFFFRSELQGCDYRRISSNAFLLSVMVFGDKYDFLARDEKEAKSCYENLMNYKSLIKPEGD